MGIKRILIAVVVVLSVLGLVVLLLFQSGIDEKVVASLLPRVESRHGVQIEYSGIEASLTSLVLNNVTVRDKRTGCRLGSAKEAAISVRVGPLFMGDIDLTAIRVEGPAVIVGGATDACDIATWRGFLSRARGTSRPAEATTKPRSVSRPDVQITAGRIEADSGFLALSVSDISGRVGANNSAFLKTGPFFLAASGDVKLIRGNKTEASFTPDRKRVTLSTEGAVFEMAISRERLGSLARDLQETVAALAPAPLPSTDPAPRQAERGDIGLSVHVRSGTGTLFNPATPDKRIVVKDISVDAEASTRRDLKLAVNGALPGTDAMFRLSASSEADAPTTVTIKIPDVTLSHLGDALFDSPHIDWTHASMDGELQLTVPPQHDEIELTGQTVFTHVTLHHERLSDLPVRDIDISADFKLRYDRASDILRLERLAISRKLARVTLRGDVHLDRLAFDISVNVPPTPCKHLREAIPDALIPKLKNTAFDGKLSADIHLDLDEANPDAVVFEPTISNGCRIRRFGDIPEPDYYRGPFTYVAFTEDMEPIRLVSGPGTDRWTPYRDITPYLIEAVLTTEDGKFWHHAGMTAPEIRRAIALNLRKQSLSHGASTITMQLAKNLLLDRERTLSRKLQEAVLVWYLESYFSKEELLEFYFNIVEFGPSIYGIRDAAMHYFGRDPADLNLIESVYLVKLLPNPPARYKSYERGKLSERQSAVLRRVMKTMNDRRRLTDTELELGLNQSLVFYRQGDPLPEPRDPSDHPALRDTKLSPLMPSQNDVDEGELF